MDRFDMVKMEAEVEQTEHVDSDNHYAVLHMIVESNGGNNNGPNLVMAQSAIIRFISVVSQIVSGWGGTLIETNLQSYTAIFSMSEPDAASRSCICGIQILNAITNVIHPYLEEAQIDLSFNCGIGISMGTVYSFETGLQQPTSRLYHGEAITNAIEYASMSTHAVFVDRSVKEYIERTETDFKVKFIPYRYHEWVGYQITFG